LYLHANYAQGRSKSHEYDIYIFTIRFVHTKKQEAGTRQDKSLLNSKTYHIYIYYIILDSELIY